MAIDMKLTGSKADIIEHLRGLMVDQAKAARQMAPKAKGKAQGVAEGLALAIDVLNAWHPDGGQPVVRDMREHAEPQPSGWPADGGHH